MTKNVNIKKLLLLAVVPLLAVYVTFCAFMQSIPLQSGVIFLAYNVVCILGVGFAVMCLMRIEAQNSAEMLVFSFSIGYCLIILWYVVLFPLLGREKISIFIWAIGICASVYSCMQLRKKHWSGRLRGKETAVLCFFLTAVLMIQIFLGVANNMSMLKTGVNSYYKDLLYWASDAVSFTKQFPPINIRDYFAGSYHYHYFSSMQIAAASICTGIRAFNYVMGFAFIQGSLFFAGTAFCFFRTILKRTWAVSLALFLLFFTTGYEKLSMVTMVSHIYSASFGTDLGMAFAMIVVLLIFRQLKEPGIRVKYFLLITLEYAVCIGVKSPAGTIAMMASGLLCLYWLFLAKQKNVSAAWLYGIMLVVVFGLMFVFVVSGLPGGNSRAGYFLSEGAEKTILTVKGISPVYNFLIYKFGYIIGQILFLGFYAVIINPAVFIPFLCIIAYRIFHLKEIEAPTDALLITVILGLAMARFVKMLGYSQMYFAICTMPFAVVVVSFYIRKLVDYLWEKGYLQKIRYIRFGVGIISLVASGLLINAYYIKPQVSSAMKKLKVALGRSNSRKIYLLYDEEGINLSNLSDPEKYTDGYIVLTEDLYNACEWLRENSNENSLIATDVMQPVEMQYPVGILSERWIWTRNTDWIESGFSGRRSVFYKMGKDGVDYIVTSADTEPGSIPDGVNIDPVYENESIQIFQIKEDADQRIES